MCPKQVLEVTTWNIFFKSKFVISKRFHAEKNCEVGFK